MAPAVASAIAAIARVRRWLATERGREALGVAAPIAVFLAALAPRLWFAGEHPIELYLVSNMAFFDERARHLVSGDLSIRDTFTPVGYPALLAPVYAWSGTPHAMVAHAQAVLGALTAVLTHVLARRLTRSAWAALGAGLAVALYLPLVVYGGFLLTETVFAFLVALFAVLLTEDDMPSSRRVALAGLVLGTAVAVRPNLLLAFPLLAAHALYLRRVSAPRRRWAAPLWAMAFALPVLAAAAAHNTRIAGRPTFLATNGGVNFFLGHCECRAVTFPPGTGIAEVSGHQNRRRYTEVVASPGPAYDEAYFYGRTLGLLAREPGRLLRAFVNVGDGLGLTGPGAWPAQPYYPGWMGHEDALRAFGRGFAWLAIVPVLVHAGLLAARRRLLVREEAPRLFLLALVGAMLATLLLYLGDPRMRVPFDPLLIALAADAWRSLGARLQGSRPGP